MQSFLLNRIIGHLRTVYGEDFSDAVGITAATGIAATHIGGEANDPVLDLSASQGMPKKAQ